ncbi:uncharacterized protein LOC121509728 [Cheilinus undulatus]|uniref:uncharacterized protein LOC121509728 n=1 Tax=Cheilinus undulatus TaxID=241271 RepID=UPI001BD5EF1F|nr:uncharacterized protein LOC121509728 [Cheilinus undulatus]
MMDDLTPNNSHIPRQSWVVQNGWSTNSTQGPPLNPLSSSQHPSLGSSTDQRSLCDHLQMPSQSCMRDFSTLSSRNDTLHSALHKDFQAGSNLLPSNTLFANTAMPNVSEINPFAQEVPHTSSVLLSANQEKGIPPLSLTQRNQTQQLPFFSPHNSSKMQFHPLTTSQASTNGVQNLPIHPPSCGQPVRTSQAAIKGGQVEFAGIAGYTQSYASSASQEHCAWISSSQCGGTVNESIPDSAAQPNKEQSQDRNINAQASNDRQRLALLSQRTKLLQQLADLDKALESLPPEDSSDSLSPHQANQLQSLEETSQSEQTKASDDQQVETSAEKSQKKECASSESGDEGNSDDPVSDEDFSALIPDQDGFSSDDSSYSRPSSPISEKPASPEQEHEKQGNSPCKTGDVSPPEKAREFSWKKSAKTVVAPSSNSTKCRTNRKNYCLFCSKPVTKMARHLENIHCDKPEVAIAFQYPKKSRERLKIWQRLINQGNFAHNKVVLRTGKGQLAAKKRPTMSGQAQDFLHCLYCHGLFLNLSLARHMRRCPEKVKRENESGIGKKRMAWLCAMEVSDDLCISDGLKNILSVMLYDEVTRTIMDDNVILQFGELLFSQHGSDEKRHEYIRQNLRQVARLVLEAQKTSSLKKLEDFFTPSNFLHVVSFVKVLAGYDPQKNTYKAPSLAIKLGYTLQKACGIVEKNAVKCGDEHVAESARQFLSVYQEKWTKLISSGALKVLRKTEVKNKKKVPFAEDVKQLNLHLEKVQEVAEKKLRDSPSAENYGAQAKVILARTILFNRRSAREVSYVELKAFRSREKSSSLTGLDVSVSDMERAMCAHFTRIDLRGKCGRKVPVFLKPTILSALEYLVEVREICGVPKKNPFLFGRPDSLTPYHGSDCLQKFIKACGAKDPEALNPKKIRQHYAEMLQTVGLDANEANQILGPQGQAQRQDSNMQLSGVKMDSDARSHSSVHSGPSTSSQQGSGEMRGTNMKTTQKPAHSNKKGSRGKNKQVHRTWEEAEVRAVERHLMRFIRGHKVPQKDDCVACLEEEQEALSTRSWKGVKDYVRNRITALKRKKKSSKA